MKSNIELAKSSRIKENFKEEYRTKDKEVKKSMRKNKRKWADELASEAERAAGNGRMKELLNSNSQITKTLCNEKSKTCNTVKDKDGNLLTEDSK